MNVRSIRWTAAALVLVFALVLMPLSVSAAPAGQQQSLQTTMTPASLWTVVSDWVRGLLVGVFDFSSQDATDTNSAGGGQTLPAPPYSPSEHGGSIDPNGCPIGSECA
ncbi:MAG: hypothetical protein KDD11_03615 [Acidobacteria bacterium]|nr:hypothetical protein [Acidobacteriota bacterium]